MGKLKRIAIDEIHLGRRSGYLTVVMDLDSGAVVEVAEGKEGAALEPFWKRVKHSQAQVRAVATDMGPAYIKAVRENLPQAILVFEHFHVIKLYNEKLSNLRQALAREADALGKKVLKGTHWLLLKSSRNLDVEKDEHIRLQEALRLNQPLATAYYTSHRHNMNFIESLKIQGEKRIKFLLILCVSFAQTVRDRRLEVLECLIISGIQTLSFDELPKPLNQI